MSDYSYLNSLENTYDAAQEATGGKLPDGRYTAILNEARLYPPDEKRAYPRFSTSWVVTEGEYKGRFLYMISISTRRASHTSSSSPTRWG